MLVVSETDARTTTTPAATVAGLAAPSQGSQELSSWRVRMLAGAAGPVHTIDREQVWMPVTGALTVTVDGDTSVVSAGEAVILPAGAVRQISTDGGPADVLVCMGVGGQATVPGSTDRHRLPWAE
jgi:quercetin dioxygenase-like cupin family protein